MKSIKVLAICCHCKKFDVCTIIDCSKLLESLTAQDARNINTLTINIGPHNHNCIIRKDTISRYHHVFACRAFLLNKDKSIKNSSGRCFEFVEATRDDIMRRK